jgi:type IV secretion system protein VirD4
MFGRKRGMDMPAYGDAHFAVTPEMQRIELLGPKGIRLGYYRAPGQRDKWGTVIRYAGDAGLILIAPARSGKTRDVLAGALLEYEQSTIVIDPKGQLASITKRRREKMGQRVITLNPFDVWSDRLGPSARYNPMDLLDPSARDWDVDCRKLAEGLIARSNETNAAHWIGGARGLVTGLIGGLVAHGAEGTNNLAHVREILCSDDLLLKYARASLNSPHAFIRQELSSFAVKEPHNAGELASFKQNAREQTPFLGTETIADNMRRSDFRFAELKDRPTTVYIILPDNRLDVCGHWFRLIVASALDDLWRGGKGAYRVLAILDEFAQIGHLDVLENAAAAAAGRGVQIWPVVQNIPQLKKDYGEVWETFFSAADMRMVMAPREYTSAEYISKLCGQRTVTTAGQSVNNTGPFGKNNESDQSGQAGQPLIRPHEICRFGKNESLIIGPENIVINALRRPYYETPELQGLYDPDPMHKHDAVVPQREQEDSRAAFAVGGERAERSLALRLMTWGKSRNPYLNAVLKVAFIITLPVRIALALVAAPFAVFSRPAIAPLSLPTVTVERKGGMEASQ